MRIQTTESIKPLARMRAHAGFTRDSLAEYLRRPEVSRSTLDQIRRSPLHLQHYLTNPKEDTPAMLIGRVFHAMVEAEATGNEKIVSESVAVWTGGDRRGKAWEEFKLAHANRDIVKANELQDLERMRDSLFRHQDARAIIKGSTFEATAIWKDESTGVGCKARLDMYRDGFVCDIKTSADIDYDAFVRSAFNFGYHRQGAWYMDAARAVTGLTPSNFVMFVVEKEAPYAVRLFRYEDEAIAAGRAENRKNLDLYAVCKKANSWPGFPEPELLALPRWA